MTLDERVVDRMISIGNIEDLRIYALDANDEYYASILMTMVRDAEAYLMAIRNEEDFIDMAIDINDASFETNYLYSRGE
tara:strand:+ start:1813 stop:2049 length:237 start_codon:yes stop_codon:yes gene_type:complete